MWIVNENTSQSNIENLKTDNEEASKPECEKFVLWSRNSNLVFENVVSMLEDIEFDFVLRCDMCIT